VLDLLIKNIGVLATPKGSSAKCGAEQNAVDILQNSYIGVEEGLISCVGAGSVVPDARKVIDAQGLLVTPGLVDAHTHAVFGGWRQHEMELKLSGMGYLDILAAGGGILSTVRSTREASEDELFEKTSSLLKQMLAHGTTACEIKSGYGLSLDDEIKQLKVINRLKKNSKQDIAATFMGAHAIPGEFKNNREGYIRLLTNEVMPKAAKLAEFADVFCETGVFSPEETKRILNSAREYGLKLKLHADEIDPIGGAGLAAELGAISAEHLIQASDDGIMAMAQQQVIAVLLPATSLYLDKPFARARYMIEQGVAVAISTDFNPGSSPNFNLQLPMSLACIKYKLTPAEALTAVTLNAAAAINRANLLGGAEVGKQADIVIWNCPDLNFLFYRYGNNQVHTVIKKGEIV